MTAAIDKREQFLAGMKKGVPCILGFVPVGIAYAIMARRAGLTVLQTTMMSVTVYAGASQMVAMGLYMQGAGLMAMILTTFIVNLRHVIMSICVFDRMEPTRPGMKLLCGFGVTDEGFAIFTTGSDAAHRSAAYFLGINAVTYASWIVGSFVGAVITDVLPLIITLSFGVSLYAMYIGVIVPAITKNARLAVLVLITALCNWGLNQVMSSTWALIVSTLACAFVGIFFVDLREEKEDTDALPENGAASADEAREQAHKESAGEGVSR